MKIGCLFFNYLSLLILPWFLSSCNPFKRVTDKVRALVIEGRIELRPGECSPQYKVVAYTIEKKKGIFGEDKNIDLNGEADGAFYRDDKCINKITSVTLPQGRSEVAFHYKNQINAKAVLLKADLGSSVVPGYLPVGIFKKAWGKAENWGLDPTFGSGGKVVTAVGTWNDFGQTMAIQGDGKILLGGYSTGGCYDDFSLVRYNPDGSLDSSFNGSGKVTTNVSLNSGGSDRAQAIAIQSDGNILLGGYATNAIYNFDFALARYLPNGTLDPTFGSGGKILTNVGVSSDFDEAKAIALQSDGKILLAGYAQNMSASDFALARFLSNGTLDTTFGSGGKILTNVSAFSGGSDVARAITLQSDGKILLAGYAAGASYSSDFALARFLSSGTLDLTFGSGGKILTNVSVFPGSYDVANAITLQSDGKILLAGYAAGASSIDFALARFLSSGTLDSTFGSGGKTLTNVSPYLYGYDVANAIALQSDGKILLAGYATDSTDTRDFALARYLSNGTLEPTFGSGGKILTSVAPYLDDWANAIVLQPDGKILLGGNAHHGSNQDFALVRLANLNKDNSLQKLVEDILRDPKNEAMVRQKLKDIEKKLREEEGLDGVLAISGPTEVLPQKCSEYTIEVPLEDNDTLDKDLTIKLITESKALFHAKNDCSDAPISQVTAKARNRSTTFYMQDAYTEPVLLKAEAKDFVAGYLAVAVRGDLPTKLVLTGPTKVAADVCSSAFTVTTQDEKGEASFVVADTHISLSGFGMGKAYSDANCAEVISELVIPFGSAYKSFYFKDSVAEKPIFAATYKSSDLATLHVSVRDFNYEDTGEKKVNVTFTHKKSENAEVSIELSNIQSKYLNINSETRSISFVPNKLTQAKLSVDVIRTGSLDLSYGVGGAAKVSVGSSHDYGEASALQGDGKVLIAGRSRKNGYFQFALTRQNPDGSPDTSFGTGGTVTTKVGKYHAFAEAIQLKWDGKIVVGGYADMGMADGYNDFAVVRYTASGALDTTFGSGGIVTLPFGLSHDMLHSLAILAEGKILCVGQAKYGSYYRFAITRLNDDGTLDDTFGAGGFVALRFTSKDSIANDVKVLPDGKFFVLGNANGTNHDFALAKFHSNGALDTTFGAGRGKVLTSVGGLSDYGRSLDLQIDGSVIAAGYSMVGATQDFAIVRYAPLGALDPSFGTGGIVTTSMGSSHDYGNDVAVQSDGRIALAGYVSNGSNFDFALAHYNSDGTLDAAFGPDKNGKVITPIGNSHDYGKAIILLPSAEIMITGSTNISRSNYDFASARYRNTLPGSDPDHPTSSFIDELLGEIEKRRKQLKESNDPLLLTFLGPTTIKPSVCTAYKLGAAYKLEKILNFLDPNLGSGPFAQRAIPTAFGAKLFGGGNGAFYLDHRCLTKIGALTLQYDLSTEWEFKARVWYKNNQPELVIFQAEPELEEATNAFFPVGIYETIATK